MRRRPPTSTRTDTLFPYTTLFRSHGKRSRDYQEKRPLHGGLSFAVIRMICKDARGTPQLLGQHDPRHHMRPGRPTEGNQQIRPLPLRFIETVSRPDQEAALTDPLVAPCLQLAGRSEERRVGKECVSTWRSGGAPYH